MKSLFQLSLENMSDTQINSLSGLNIELSREDKILLRLERQEENFEKLVSKETRDFLYKHCSYKQLVQLYNL